MMHGGMRRIAQTSEEKAQDQSKVVMRLLQYMAPYKAALTGALLLIVVNAGAQAAGPFLIGRAVDQYIARGDTRGLAVTMLILLGVYLVGMAAMRFQIYLIASTGQRVLADLRVKIMEKMQTLSLQFVENREAGDLMSRLVNDIDAINTFFSQALSQSAGALFALVGIMIAMIALNWQLALAALAIVPVMMMTTGQFARMARRAFRKTRTTIGDVSADLQEELGGVKVAQAFSRTDRNIRDFARRNRANRDANVNANAVTSAFAPAMDVLSTIDTAIVAGYGGFLAISGVVSVGVVVSFLQYVQNFFRPIRTVSQMWTIAQSAFAAAERVFELVDTDPQITDPAGAVSLPPLEGRVVFENVTFGYNPDHP
ncbi:MAG: ABC transporter ATP-binding protein, partial [Anaerolineales bacterium]